MKNKLYASLLKAYKKANKVRREKIAKKYGYPNGASYKEYLIGMVDSSPQESTEYTDMVIAFDTTSSMNRYITEVKKHVEDLIPELLSDNPNLRISIVAFGDYCDMNSRDDFGKAYQVIDLTRDANALISFVQGAQGTSGGDYDEFYELVLNKIRLETNWTEGSNKSILLIADAVPHAQNYVYAGYSRKLNWRDEARLLGGMGVQVDTLAISNETWYKELSQITNGVALPFRNAKNTNKLVKASALARGGAVTKDKFMDSMSFAASSGDAETTAVYRSYDKKFVD